MVDNCKSCFSYDVEYDELEQQLYDEDIFGKPSTPPHYCISFDNGIPDDIWCGKTQCPRYLNLSKRIG